MLAVDIRNYLTPETRAYMGDIDVFHRLSSTQQVLLSRPTSHALWQLVVAEEQTSGIGRQTRQWYAGMGQISFSLRGWVSIEPSSIGLLSLLASLCVHDVLTSHGLSQVTLKWPNDVFLNYRKISGILISVANKSQNKFDIVLGIGLNRLRLSQKIEDVGMLDIASLSDALPNTPDVSELIADILNAWFTRLPLIMTEKGRAGLITEWQYHAQWLNQSVMVVLHDRQVDGVFRGITLDGGLMLETTWGEQIFSAGEVQLRSLMQFN